MKQGGGNGGHNGLRSLDQALRSAGLRSRPCGIGRPPAGQDPADFVLQPVGAQAHEADLATAGDHAADAVRASITDGLEARPGSIQPLVSLSY